MAVVVRVGGTPPAEIRRIAALMREQHRTRQRQFNAELREQMRPLERAIRESTPEYMPSGYEPTIVKAIRVRTLIRQTGIRARVMAMGRSEQRDVAALNAGLLRHKLFGNPLRWFSQHTRAGFVDNPVRRAADEVYRGLEDVCDRIRQRIERG